MKLEALVYQHQTQVNVLDHEVAEMRKIDRQRIAQLSEELDKVKREKGVLQTIVDNGLLERLKTLPASIVHAVQQADSEKSSLREQVARLRPFEKMYEDTRRSHEELVETNKNLRLELDRLRQELSETNEGRIQLQSELELLRGRILAVPDGASDMDKPQRGHLISQFSFFSVLIRLLSLRYWVFPSAIQR
jgi:chromosome segregation ATPase